MQFSDNLRILRKEKDYSQEHLAEVMNVSRQTVSKWENGSAMPDLKKLTELAEFFNTNMDTLLGIEGAENAPQAESMPRDIDLSPYIQHTEQLFTVLSENQRSANEKKYKTAIIVLSLCLCILACFMTVSYLALSGEVSSLRARLNSMEPQVVVQQPEIERNDLDDDVAVLIVSRDEIMPWLVNVKLMYAPENYANDSAVTFDIVRRNETVQRLEAVLTDGVFTAQGAVDLTLFENCYINVDDGTNTRRMPVSWDPVWQYVSFKAYGRLDYSMEGSNHQYRYDFTASYDDFGEPPRIYFSDAVCGAVEKAELVVKLDGKAPYRKPLTVNHSANPKDDDNLYVEIPSFSFDANDEFTTMEVYLEVTDALGVRYRCHYDNGESENYYFDAESGTTTIVFPMNMLGLGDVEVGGD